MEKGDIRQIFLHACNEVGEILRAQGFRPVRNGQVWKRTAGNRDVRFDVTFQSSHYNCISSIEILPYLSIFSKKAKEQECRYGFPQPCGLVWGLPLRSLASKNRQTEWNLAGASYSHAVQEIQELFQRYAFPLFAHFEPPQAAVPLLREKGCLFYPSMCTQNDSLTALPFLLSYGTQEDAECYFNRYVARSSGKKRFYALYGQLARKEPLDSFIDAQYVQLAYNSGLRLLPAFPGGK